MNDLWYFAYGANMAEALFVGRRGMRPMDREVGVLAEYRLAFDLPTSTANPPPQQNNKDQT